MKNTDNTMVIYNGGGFLWGLPARDMAAEEWELYPRWLRDAAIKSGLYRIVKSETKDAE